MNFKFWKPTLEVEVHISKAVLDAIYNECDKFEVDETGGRLVGFYQKEGNKYKIRVHGAIEPGPAAKRSATSFYQDGHYQEKIFREIERKHPDIEALGNWHTHHVNGYPELSGGDLSTYHRTVNHGSHNTDFFYALLVTEKVGGPHRYKVKHYFFRRNDPESYEIPQYRVHIGYEPAVWPSKDRTVEAVPKVDRPISTPNKEGRLSDLQVFSEFYPKIKPYKTPETGILYWKGSIDLVDGTKVALALLENEEGAEHHYELKIIGDPAVELVLKDLVERKFKNARMAARAVEQRMNQEVYLKGVCK